MSAREKKRRKQVKGSRERDDEPRTRTADGAAEAEAAPEQDLEFWRDRALRAQAEMINMRKRMEQDVEERTRMRLEGLLHELIVLSDHMGLALEALPQGLQEDQSCQSFLQGLGAIQAALQSTMLRYGLETIQPESDQEFDPEHHEAVHIEERAELESPRLHLLRPGYRMGRRILRPAQVRLLRPVAARAVDEHASDDEDPRPEAG